VLESAEAPGERRGGLRAIDDYISDQSQFSQHFTQLGGVTPGRFRTPARIA
jgi:hypothetical protein